MTGRAWNQLFATRANGWWREKVYQPILFFTGHEILLQKQAVITTTMAKLFKKKTTNRFIDQCSLTFSSFILTIYLFGP